MADAMANASVHALPAEPNREGEKIAAVHITRINEWLMKMILPSSLVFSRDGD